MERFWVGQLQQVFARFSNRVSFEWLNELSLEEVRQRVAALPAHSAVLYTMMIADAAGVPHEGRAALASIVEVSAGAGIQSSTVANLDKVSSAAPTTSEQHEAAQAAALALRALSGQIPTDPTIQVVDYDPPVV